MKIENREKDIDIMSCLPQMCSEIEIITMYRDSDRVRPNMGNCVAL